MPRRLDTTTRMSLEGRRIIRYAAHDSWFSNSSTDLGMFGQIQYKTLSWPLVAVLMIAEIVSNGMLSLPSSLAVVGLVPGLVLIIFLGVFALFTSWLLIQFKLRHPEGKRPISVRHCLRCNSFSLNAAFLVLALM